MQCVTIYVFLCHKPVVPNLSGTRDGFRGRQFFHGLGVGGMVQEVMRAMGGMVQEVMRAMEGGT